MGHGSDREPSPLGVQSSLGEWVLQSARRLGRRTAWRTGISSCRARSRRSRITRIRIHTAQTGSRSSREAPWRIAMSMAE